MMPVLFLGHGSPMNAIEENEFVSGFRKIAEEIPKPEAIVCMSAHWETKGTQITAMEHPRTIHDFGGFPQKLYEVHYPAPGDPRLAAEIRETLKEWSLIPDTSWGLDHGTWSVVKHLFPKADVPVIQISLDYHKSPEEHYKFASALSWLREKRILIIGSGNMVHNLRLIAWDRMNEPEFGYDWALEASARMKKFILDSDHPSLINYRKQGKAFELAVPTTEHFLPLLYALALKRNDENVTFFNDKPVGGSLTMTSVKIGH